MKNEDGNWFVIIAVKIKQIKTKLDKSLICGVDIGVKNAYNAIVLQETKQFTKELNSELKIKTLPLTCAKETKEINEKLCRIKNNLQNIYKRLKVYSNIIKNNYSSTFTE